jgi:hypothetical protein
LESLPGAATILSEENANIVFRLEGEFGFLHQREAAKEIWLREFGKGNISPGICLISGDETLIANLHPAIKGVRDAQTRGACIVSFNANAFTSFGKESGANAPVSATAICTLCRSPARRTRQPFSGPSRRLTTRLPKQRGSSGYLPRTDHAMRARMRI